ncbi:MAG: hypothetical protein IIC81_09680, partial [Chloroflexi bacterium]|nr:hypothetical protein [Chloroflexota bacterium]
TLMQESLTGKDLTEEQARQLANRLQANTDAIARFEQIEKTLETMAKRYDADKEDTQDEIVKVYTKAKYIGGALIAGNYVGDFAGPVKNKLGL